MQSQRVFCELQTNSKHYSSEFVDSEYDFSLSDIFAKQLKWGYCFVMPEAVAHRCSVKKVFLNISQNWQENTCTSLFFNQVACITDSQPATLLKTRLWRRCFRVNFAKFLKTPFVTEHLPWLILKCDHWHGNIQNKFTMGKNLQIKVSYLTDFYFCKKISKAKIDVHID